MPREERERKNTLFAREFMPGFIILFQKRLVEGDDEFSVDQAINAVWQDEEGDQVVGTMDRLARLFNRRPKDIKAEKELTQDTREELKARKKWLREKLEKKLRVEGRLPEKQKKKSRKEILGERARRWQKTNVDEPHPSDNTDDPFRGSET